MTGHALHERSADAVSADISCPAPHRGCTSHAVERWLAASWYSSAPHATHDPACVVLYGVIFWPLPQYGCATHAPLDM